MIDFVSAAGDIISSPAVWMIIAGMLLMKVNMQQLSNISLQYKDGLTNPHAWPLRKHFIYNIAAAILSAAASIAINVSLSLETLIVFWILMLIMQAVGAMAASAFLSALAVFIISRFININFVSSDVLEAAVISQAIMAVLLTIDSPDAYPLIVKQKDGTINGVHNHYKIWFMPVFAYSISLADMHGSMLFMFFYILNAKFKKETYKDYKKRNSIFMLSLSVLAAIFAVILKNYDIVILAGGALAIMWTVFEKIKSLRAEGIFLPAGDGVRVLYVNPGGAGDKAGILPGDIIISFNNNRVMNISGIENFLSGAPAHVFIDVLRKKKLITLEYRDYQNGIDSLECSYIPRKPVKYQFQNN